MTKASEVLVVLPACWDKGGGGRSLCRALLACKFGCSYLSESTCYFGGSSNCASDLRGFSAFCPFPRIRKSYSQQEFQSPTTLIKMHSRFLLFPVLGAVATDIHAIHLQARQAITTLTPAQIAAFKPFSFFASAGYCQPSTTLSWNCGENCNANPGFIPVASGGDGSSVQFWYVGYDPALNTVIVSHQGDDASKVEADATDVNFFLKSLDPSLFPGIKSSVEAHSGFADEHAKTATQVLSAVRTALSAHKANSVTIVGHSLGAAIALLDGVYLPLHISGVTFKTIGYGMPRVGNQAFADYVDAHLSLTHINNKKDPVPTLPGKFLGYHHPSGEVHIQDSGTWVSCPGQDNPSTQCIVGDVPNIFEGDIRDHPGPYDGVTMGC